MMAVCYRYTKSIADAEDVLQEVFMQIWRSPDGCVATRGSLGGWLAVVSRNRSIDTLRRKRPTESVDDLALASNYNLANEAERAMMIELRRRGHTVESQKKFPVFYLNELVGNLIPT